MKAKGDRLYLHVLGLADHKKSDQWGHNFMPSRRGQRCADCGLLKREWEMKYLKERKRRSVMDKDRHKFSAPAPLSEEARKILTGGRDKMMDEAIALARETYKEALVAAQKAYDEICKEALPVAQAAYDEIMVPARKALEEARAKKEMRRRQ